MIAVALSGPGVYRSMLAHEAKYREMFLRSITITGQLPRQAALPRKEQIMTTTTLNLNESPMCEVTYVSENGQDYAKLKKEDFQLILNERRGAFFLMKTWIGFALIGAFMAAGTAYWYNTHPATIIKMVTPTNAN
jgi:hypothetical protein